MRFIAPLALLALVSGCATPYLKKKDGKAFTLCCAQCDASGWKKKLDEICPKAAFLKETVVKIPDGPNEEKEKLTRTTVTHFMGDAEVCRSYSCPDDITANESPF